MALDYKMRLGDEVSISWLRVKDEYVKVKTITSKDAKLHFDIMEGISEKEYFKRKLSGTD